MFIFYRLYRWSSPELKSSHIWLLHSKAWQTAFTSWKMKPSPVSSASLWTAPVAEPHWGMWHWVQAQDFQWPPLQWLKLNPGVTTGGSSYCCFGQMWLVVETLSCIIFWLITQAIWLMWQWTLKLFQFLFLRFVFVLIVAFKCCWKWEVLVCKSNTYKYYWTL